MFKIVKIYGYILVNKIVVSMCKEYLIQFLNTVIVVKLAKTKLFFNADL